MEATSTHLISETRAERERLAGLLGDLTPEAWDMASLCDGWRVREVLAHMTMPYRTKPVRMMAGLARAGFSFNRYADRDARSAARAMDEAELLDLLRRNIEHPWRPPGGGQAGALSHDVIHGLDFTEPLGLPSPPAERLALVLGSGTAQQLKYFGVDLGGRRLTATDSEAVVGEGSTVVAMTSKDMLLAVTGRRPLGAA